MTKNEVIQLFGSINAITQGLGIARRTWYNWPDPLKQSQVDRIFGAYNRISEDNDSKLVYVFSGQPNEMV